MAPGYSRRNLRAMRTGCPERGIPSIVKKRGTDPFPFLLNFPSPLPARSSRGEGDRRSTFQCLIRLHQNTVAPSSFLAGEGEDEAPPPPLPLSPILRTQQVGSK